MASEISATLYERLTNKTCDGCGQAFEDAGLEHDFSQVVFTRYHVEDIYPDPLGVAPLIDDDDMNPNEADEADFIGERTVKDGRAVVHCGHCDEPYAVTLADEPGRVTLVRLTSEDETKFERD